MSCILPGLTWPLHHINLPRHSFAPHCSLLRNRVFEHASRVDQIGQLLASRVSKHANWSITFELASRAAVQKEGLRAVASQWSDRLPPCSSAHSCDRVEAKM
eukprot:1998759-Pleurochrysis_carterae.AAC.1